MVDFRNSLANEFLKIEKGLPKFPTTQADSETSESESNYYKEVWAPPGSEAPEKAKPGVSDDQFLRKRLWGSRYDGVRDDVNTTPGELKDLFAKNQSDLDLDEDGFVSKEELWSARTREGYRYDNRDRILINVLGEFADEFKGMNNDGLFTLGGISMSDMNDFHQVVEKVENGSATNAEIEFVSEVQKFLPGTMDLTSSKGLAYACDYYFEHLDENGDGWLTEGDLYSVLDDQASDSELAAVARTVQNNFESIQSSTRSIGSDYLTEDDIAKFNRAVNPSIAHDMSIDYQRWESIKKYGIGTLSAIGTLATGALTAGLGFAGVALALESKRAPSVPIQMTAPYLFGQLAGVTLVATVGLGYLSYTNFRDAGDFGISDDHNYYERKRLIEGLLTFDPALSR